MHPTKDVGCFRNRNITIYPPKLCVGSVNNKVYFSELPIKREPYHLEIFSLSFCAKHKNKFFFFISCKGIVKYEYLECTFIGRITITYSTSIIPKLVSILSTYILNNPVQYD